MPTRVVTAAWEGRLRDGKGSFSGESGVISGDFSSGSRFADGAGSAPEEMLAAAQAACYTMALTSAMEKAGTPAERIETGAECVLERHDDGWRVATIRLNVVARAPGADRDTFKDLAESTVSDCAVSRALLGNVELQIDARLEESALVTS